MNLKSINEKYKKYLPSKEFTTIIFVIIAVVGIFMIFSLFSKKESFFATKTKNNTALKIENQTINDLIQKDSDGDGIPDWEEALWGTDKNKAQTFDNTPDAIYVENKKRELGVDIEKNVDENKLTETEKFAREFFASFSAMKASGQIDTNTINSFSNALGQKIVNPSLIDIYTEKDVKINTADDSNDIINKLKYYEQVQDLFKIYQSSGIGDELDIINSGLALYGGTADKDPYSKLPSIATAYQNFAKKIMALSVPSEFAIYHLRIANSSNNTGISVLNMKEIITDPLIGLEGISQYQKYSADLVKAAGDLETALTQ